MNAYKLHGQSGRLVIAAVCKYLGIGYSEIYKILKDVDGATGIIETKEGKKYRLELTEIIEDESN